LNPGHPFVVDVGWGARLAQSQDFTAAVSLVDAQGVSRQTERFPVSDNWPTSQWPANAIAWGYYLLPVSPHLPAGPYSVTLQLLDPAGQALGGSLLLASATLQAGTCEFTEVPGAVDANARFGDSIELAGYEYRQQPGELKLTLYWRGLRAMSTDYTVFVHVFDPATGAVPAQSDRMPRGGLFRTSFWWPGDLVADTIKISLDGVPAGTYRLALGLYDLATMQRLPVVDGRDQPAPDGRLVLDDILQVTER
jgi:hypothetical protein